MKKRRRKRRRERKRKMKNRKLRMRRYEFRPDSGLELLLSIYDIVLLIVSVIQVYF